MKGALLALITASWLASSLPASGRVVQQAELTTLPGIAGEVFGWSVAIAGDTLVVGAPGVRENGPLKSAAFVFKNEAGGWTQVGKLVGTNAIIGVSVAISGDGKTVAVGNGGKVFVFVEPAGGWTNMTQTAELQSNGLGFGTSVAIGADGKIVAVGGLNHAAVYEEPEGGWAGTVAAAAKLATPSGAQRYGSSIALDGNTVLVGDPAFANSLGSAFVYVLHSGRRTIPISATLSPSDAGGNFGYSVSISGSTIATGAVTHDSIAGAVYVFVKPPGGWTDMTQTAELSLPPSGQTALGSSVAVSGNIVISGATGDTIGHNADQGAVFAYLKPSGGWVDTSIPNLSVTGSDSTANDEFGYSVALSGKTAVVGAPFHTVNGNVMQGAAYVFGQKLETSPSFLPP